MVYNCQMKTYEAGRDATERQTCASVANSVANRRLRLVQSKISCMSYIRAYMPALPSSLKREQEVNVAICGLRITLLPSCDNISRIVRIPLALRGAARPVEGLPASCPAPTAPVPWRPASCRSRTISTDTPV